MGEKAKLAKYSKMCFYAKKPLELIICAQKSLHSLPTHPELSG